MSFPLGLPGYQHKTTSPFVDEVEKKTWSHLQYYNRQPYEQISRLSGDFFFPHVDPRVFGRCLTTKEIM